MGVIISNIDKNRVEFLRIVGFVFILLVISIFIGILGLHYFANFSWIDSFMDSTLLLTGAGIKNDVSTNSGKVFVSFLSMYGAIFFLVVISVLVSRAVQIGAEGNIKTEVEPKPVKLLNLS